jgi:hypothetical protein
MGLVVGSLFPRGDAYPKPQQPGGPGTPVVAPVQPAAALDGVLSVPPFPLYLGPPDEKMTRFFAGCGHGFMSWEIRFSSWTRPIQAVGYGVGAYGVGPYDIVVPQVGAYGEGAYGAGPYGVGVGESGGETSFETVGPAAFVCCPLCGYIQQIYYPASLLDQQDIILG